MSVVLFFAVGPNYGIDFLGGTVIEIRTGIAAPISAASAPR